MICDLGACQEEIKPPIMSPSEIAAVTNIELSLLWSTRLPMINPTPITTNSEKIEPRNHADRLIRYPNTINSLGKPHSFHN